MRCTSSELQFGALREVWYARGRGLCRGTPGRAQQYSMGKYAPDSVRVKGISIVDEPGEC